MTDDRFDDIASAHLDGATSAEEAATIAADPRLQARVQRLRAVQEAVRAVPPVDPDRRETAIAAALAAFGAPDQASARDAIVTPLAPVASRRRPAGRSLRLVGAAAAVLLVAALVPLLARLGTTSDDDTASAPTSVADDATGAGEAGDAASGTAESGAGEISTTTAPTDGEFLGTFESVEELVAAVEGSPPSAATETAPDATFDDDLGRLEAACAAVRDQAAAQVTLPVTSASAVVAGQPVIVLLASPAVGARSVEAVITVDCALLGDP